MTLPDIFAYTAQMARTLATLIKRAAFAVEQVQKKLAQTQAAEAHARQQLAHWQAQATTQPDDPASPTLGAFIARARQEMSKLEKVLQQIVALKNTQLDELRGHFAEQKRYEILAEQAAAQARARVATKQQAALDEAAGVLQHAPPRPRQT